MAEKDLLILIVDDDPDALNAIEGCLKSEFGSNLHTVTATSISQAGTQVALHDVDLICLDLHVPPFTGTETIVKMRNLAPTIPIVVITGTSPTDNKHIYNVIAAGAADMIRKSDICSRDGMQSQLAPIIITALRNSRRGEADGSKKILDAILSTVQGSKEQQDKYFKHVDRLMVTVYGKETTDDSQEPDAGILGDIRALRRHRQAAIKVVSAMFVAVVILAWSIASDKISLHFGGQTAAQRADAKNP